MRRHTGEKYFRPHSQNLFAANAIRPAFNALVDARPNVDPFLLHNSGLHHDGMVPALPETTRPTRPLALYRPSPLLVPRAIGPPHFPFYRRFPVPSPMSPGRLSPVQLRKTIKEQMMKEEDDVLVIEAVDCGGSSTGNKQRSSSTYSGSSRSPLSSQSSVSHKTEVCRSWKETIACRHGARCQASEANSTLRHVMPSEAEKEIMPATEEFESMVNKIIAPIDEGTSSSKRRLPVFVALRDS